MPGRASARGTAAAIAGAAALLACAGRHGPPPNPGAATFAFSVMDLRDSALNAHDVATAASAYADRAEVIDAGSGLVVLRGREEIRRAHARFLAACPDAHVDILDRAYAEQARIVADLERVRCRGGPPVETRVRYEIAGDTIVRVLQDGSPLFPAIPGLRE
ncbi:MAG TPA: nuclear transport factor 2 family protein [Anaeromyxobacter sp.]